MLINLRNALMAGKRLPYDAEVEYLESTGTQWIDTGFKAGSAPGIDITFSLSTLGSQVVFGGRTNVFGGRFALFNLNGGWRFDAYEQPSLNIAADTSSVFQFTYGNNTATIRNTTVGTSASVTVSPSSIGQYDIALFAINTAGTISLNMNGRIYACKIYENNVLVRDYIPVRKGAVGYLYDRVSGKLFGNAGTGDFVLGQDVVPVEYIVSTGTQYIDTGLNYFADFEIGIKLRANIANKSLGTSGTMCMERYNANNPYWRLQVNGTYYISSARITDYHIMSWKNGVFAADGVTAQTVSNPFASGTMTLFGAGGYNYPNMIYACKLWDANGVFVRSFRPVRVGTDATSWEGAMMDVLTRRIYRNAGTGAFGYGNDLKYPIPSE